MNVLIISHYFPPMQGVAPLRLGTISKYLSRMGHTITVLTTDTGEKILNPIDDVEIVSLPYFDPIRASGAERLRNEVHKSSYANWKERGIQFYRTRLNERIPSRVDPWIIPAFKQLQKWKGKKTFDVVISSYGPPASHLIARKAKATFNSFWVADFRDLWVKNHTYRGVWPFTMIERYLENKIVKEADLLTTVSEGLKRALQDSYPDAWVEVIRNGYDPDDYPLSEFSYPSEKNNPFRIIYTGTVFDQGHDYQTFFDALSFMMQETCDLPKKLRVEFYGTVSEKFKRDLQKRDLDKIVVFQGTISHQEAICIQAEADALLYLDFHSSSYDGLLSAKIYEYFKSPAPILALGVKPNSELEGMINKVEGGVICPYNTKEIAFKIDELMAEKSDYNKNQEVISQFSRKKQVEILNEILALSIG